MRLGAALHDIGKAAHPWELIGAGDAHESAGEQALRDAGMPDSVARPARMHAQWTQMPDPALEDLLVAAADTWWRGKRNDRLEAGLCQPIAAETKAPPWQVYGTLDDIASALASDAEARLVWQSQYPV